MAYKARFRPSEILVSGTWRMLTEADVDAPGCNVSESTMTMEPMI
jgi:hypothetical protein